MKIIILGRKNMKKLWKRNMVAGAVLLLVCGAIFLNGRAVSLFVGNKTLTQRGRILQLTSHSQMIQRGFL